MSLMQTLRIANKEGRLYWTLHNGVKHMVAIRSGSLLNSPLTNMTEEAAVYVNTNGVQITMQEGNALACFIATWDRVTTIPQPWTLCQIGVIKP